MEKGAPMPLRLSEYLSGKKGAPARAAATEDAAAIEKRLA
jgi:hypothetical protein